MTHHAAQVYLRSLQPASAGAMTDFLGSLTGASLPATLPLRCIRSEEIGTYPANPMCDHRTLPAQWNTSMLMKVERPSNKEIYSNKFRVKRMEMLLKIVDDILQKKDICRILDLGGRADYWLGLEHMWRNRKIYITLVDLVPTPVPDQRFLVIQGDACDLPMYADGEFDLVFSNSVLEHVGSWQNKVRMAKEVHRLGTRYFIQTPNYWFPVEPHFRSLFFHWLPRPWQRALVMRRNFAFHARTDDINEADRILNDAHLLDYFEMKSLFPNGQILRERFLGLFTKSLIAIK